MVTTHSRNTDVVFIAYMYILYRNLYVVDHLGYQRFPKSLGLCLIYFALITRTLREYIFLTGSSDHFTSLQKLGVL